MHKAREASIIIVGGGPIGATLALGLAHRQIPSILIDRITLEDMQKAPEDGRALAISKGSQKLLDSMQVWPLLAPYAEPIRQILTINGNEGATLDFSAPTASQPMGYIVEMYRLRRTLATQIQTSEYIQWLSPHSIEKLELSPSQACVHIKDGPILKGAVIVAADGKKSKTRSLANIKMTSKSYYQKAIVFTFQHINKHQGVAYEKFLPTGTFAILPMTQDRSSIVWTVPTALANQLLQMPDAEFDQQFVPYLPKEYTTVQRITPLWSYDLSFSFPNTYVKSRFALVGDAAHVIHPLAGQGLNLGFRDVKTLLKLFLEGIQLGLDIGSITLLKQYEAQTKLDHLTLLASTDLLNRLFSNNNTLLNKIRGLGLSIFDDIYPLKRSIIKYAMGINNEGRDFKTL